MFKLIFGISGASGTTLANTCLKELSRIPDLELHVIITDTAKAVARHEGPLSLPDKFVYESSMIDAAPASGSWPCDGMIICPCSINSAGCIAASISNNLLLRAAAVTLKERRPLILVLRETPFSLPLIDSLKTLALAGAIIMPFIPPFYTGNETLSGMMTQFCGHILDILKIPHNLRARWQHQKNLV